MEVSEQWGSGMQMPTEHWLNLNERLAFERPDLSKHIAPFPPPHLMQITAASTSERDFASHGVAIYQAVQTASPSPLASYKSILDFGCGCGRLARMFKGHPGKVTGCDIDGRHVDWINGHLPYMVAVETQPNATLPFAGSSFDAVISVSVFTHLDEKSQRLYLAELERVSSSGAYLFLSTHGERALARALENDSIFRMLNVSSRALQDAEAGMREGRYNFIIQPDVHLTSEDYPYGITFIPETYVRAEWSKFFTIVDVVSGAIHDFQDIVVCRRR